MRWLLQEGVGRAPHSYLVVLGMMAAPINRWLDSTKDARDESILRETYRLYFDFCDWSVLWPELTSKRDGLTPILQVSKRLAGLVPALQTPINPYTKQHSLGI